VFYKYSGVAIVKKIITHHLFLSRYREPHTVVVGDENCSYFYHISKKDFLNFLFFLKTFRLKSKKIFYCFKKNPTVDWDEMNYYHMSYELTVPAQAITAEGGKAT
jgi:hypothetical protein